MRAVPLLFLLTACASGTSDVPDDEPDARVIVEHPDANTPFIDGMPAPDAMTTMPDAMTTTGGTVDSCAQAMDLTTAALVAGGTTVTGDTTGYVDDLHPANTCTGYFPDGPDAVYVVTAPAGKTISATATDLAPGWDISIYITQQCVAAPTCVVGADAIAGGGAETATYPVTVAGTYYLIVDGYNPGVEGPYSLHVALQ